MTNASKNALLAGFAANPPASREEIEKMREELTFFPPMSYVDFLASANGGEGFIGRSYLILWKAGELTAKNAAYHVAELAPELFLFGSNGGGEAFGFDTRSAALAIVSVPFVTMEMADAKVVAPDFETFFSALSAA
jgi:hypothetical protein